MFVCLFVYLSCEQIFVETREFVFFVDGADGRLNSRTIQTFLIFYINNQISNRISCDHSYVELMLMKTTSFA